MLKTTSVQIEEANLSALRELKKRTGGSISAQVQIAIQEYIDSRHKMGLFAPESFDTVIKRLRATRKKITK